MPERFVLFHDSVAVFFECFFMFASFAVILLLVKQDHLPLWVPRRNASGLQCWTCGGWPKNGIRVSKSSARPSGVTLPQTRRFSWYFVRQTFASSWYLCQMTNGLPSSYKSCLPRSHRMEIQKRNLVDRYRIRHTLKHFLKKIGSCSVDEYSLKLKYLIELTGIIPTLGSETYHVNPSIDHLKSAFSFLRVNGETGIQTSNSSHTDGALVSNMYSGGSIV